jgi:quercetin dioxygenase-like cupin family protein
MDSTNIEAAERYRGIAARESSEPARELPGKPGGFYLDQGYGHKQTLLSQLITTLVSTRETNGKFSVLLFEGPANEPIPAHYHTQEDEWYFVLEGKIRWWHEDQHRLLYPGDSVYLPANEIHSFSLEGGYNKMIGINVAAGFEDFFDVIGSPSEAFCAPQEYEIPAEAQWREAADKFGWHGVPDYDYGLSDQS